ncbi:MAG: hypothetical protein U0168_31715 [Nannocystaceae bacterium]
MRRSTLFCTSLVLAAAMALPSAAVAAPAPSPAPVVVAHALASTATLEDAASVLGLDSDDAAAGAALTKALRKAFAARGLSGGPEMSLAEMRLTMGCERNDAYKCFAEGGKAIEVRQLVYGKLSKSGSGYQLQLTLLEVASVLDRTESRKLSASELSPDKIDATATAIVSSLLGDQTDTEPVPGNDEPVVTTPSVPPGTDTGEKPPKKYIWGRHKPVASWKKIGLGVSAGLAVAGIAIGAGLSASLVTTLKKDLRRAVDDSLQDSKRENDIPRNTPDYCVLASESKDGGKTVKNASVTRVCNKAAGVEKGQYAAWVGAGVFTVSTIAFTVLLFVRKREGSDAAAKLLRRDFALGATPMRGGVSIGSRFRF